MSIQHVERDTSQVNEQSFNSGISILRTPNRACDACKRRKVKCDPTSSPCANCQISDLRCIYSVLPKKRGPKPKRRLQAAPQPSPTLSAFVGENVHHANEQTTHFSRCSDTTLGAGPISPAPVLDNSTPVQTQNIPSTLSHCHFVEQIHTELKSYAETVLKATLKSITNKCVDLYIEFLFPVAPIIHESSLRCHTSLFDRDELFTAEPTPTSTHSLQSLDLQDENLRTIRNWTLITALCAATAFLLPASVFPTRDAVGQRFLRASREMLKHYQDYDIEHPDYTSLAIRYYHSNSLHAVGKTRVSWHVLGEAVRLTQEMRLFEERSFQGLLELESHLRRKAFWQIYTADKSASILNDCPIALHEICLGAKVTTSYDSQIDVALLDHMLAPHAGEIEKDIAAGFNLSQDLWARASDIILKLESWKIWIGDKVLLPSGMPSLHEMMTHDYLCFVGTLDNMPAAIQPEDITFSQDETSELRFTRSRSIQRTNLLVTYHCLRLVLLQKFSENGLLGLLGIREDQLSLALRKTEIASDMVRTLLEAPFESLQMNGEPCVEKIRRIGVALLETVNEIDSASLIQRAKSLFLTLLDILARLDSRVSEELGTNRGF